MSIYENGPGFLHERIALVEHYWNEEKYFEYETLLRLQRRFLHENRTIALVGHYWNEEQYCEYETRENLENEML